MVFTLIGSFMACYTKIISNIVKTSTNKSYILSQKKIRVIFHITITLNILLWARRFEQMSLIHNKKVIVEPTITHKNIRIWLMYVLRHALIIYTKNFFMKN